VLLVFSLQQFITDMAGTTKKAGKAKSVSKDIKEVNDKAILEKSDTKRERKTPARFSIAVAKPVTRELVITKGRGVNLGSIPEVAEELSKRKMDDPTLMTLHHLAFGMAAKRIRVKANLRQFSGVKFDDKLDRAKLEQRIQSRSYAVIRNVCTLLHLPSGGSTAELVGRLADFLERPVAPEGSATKKRAKPAAKKTEAKKPAAKKPAAKKTEKKPAEKKAVKKTEKKPAAKKPKTEKKPAEKAKKPAAEKKTEKKPAEKKPKEAKKPAAKKTTKAATKK